MKEIDVFIEQSKAFFDRYCILDSKQVDDLELKRCKGSYIAIAGEYYLNRKYENVIYQKNFNMVVLIDRTKRIPIPIVWLREENKPEGFNHLYDDRTCCLGLTHEIINLWGEMQDAKTFYLNIVDTFLISLISYSRTGKSAIPERPHEEKGIIDYYKSFFDVKDSNIIDILGYLYSRAKRKELAKGHNDCPCGSGKKLKKCHQYLISNFLNSLYQNTELLKSFMQDYEIIEKLKEGGKLNG